MYCPNCRNQVADGVDFCPSCGTNLKQIQRQINPQTMQQPTYNQPQNNYQAPANNQMSSQNNYQPKSNKKSTGLVVLVVLIIIGIGVFLIFNGKGDSKNEMNNNNNTSTVNNNDNNNNDNNGNNTPIVSGDLTIATLGHVDHGKTPLTSAITKYFGTYVKEEDIDRAPEVKKNNVTFNASTVTYKTQNRKYLQYDFPGHADIVKGLLSGAVQLDGAILVVSTTDGPMPQTREHLLLLREIGVPRVVVYMNNCDQISDNELIGLVEMEIRELLNEYGFDGDKTPIIKGSTTKALEGDKSAEQSIKDLMSAVDQWINPLNRNEKTSSHKEFKASIYVLSKEEGGRHTPFFNDYKPEIVAANSTAKGTIKLPAGVEMVMPGDNVDITVNLDNTLSIKKGQYFQLKEDNKVIGVGVISSITN